MSRTIGLVTLNYTVPGFGPLTEKRPPAALPFAGRYRLMDFPLSNMVNSGIRTVGLITPYYYRSVLDHVGAGKAFGLDRKEGGLLILPGTVYGLREQESRLVFRDITHNSVFLERGGGDYVLVSSASYIYNMDYRPMIEQHEMSGHPVTFLCKKLPAGTARSGRYLITNDNGRVTDIVSRDRGENLYLDCFIIDKSFLLRLMKDYRAMDHYELLSILKDTIRTNHFSTYFYDGYVGYTDGMQDYMKTSMDLMNTKVRKQLFPAERPIHTKTHDDPPAQYVPGADVRNAVCGAGTIIEGKVENSLIFGNVRIAKDAVVKNCIIMENCVVGEGARLEYTVCDKQVNVSPNACITGTADHPCIFPKGSNL